MELLNLIDRYVENPEGTEENLFLANAYFSLGQYAAAVTHYIKCLEATEDEAYETRYHCLLMLSSCYRGLGNRPLAEIQYARFAKAEMPDRPQAYYVLARARAERLVRDKQMEAYDWLEVYENARIGVIFGQGREEEDSIYYHGLIPLKVLYCLALLRLSMHDDLKHFLDTTDFTGATGSNLDMVIYVYNEIRYQCPYTTYDAEKDRLKIPLEGVEKNYSQSMQDLFTLTCLGGKRNGTYLEIGAGDPEYGSNTKLLETLGWRGLSVDTSAEFCAAFRKGRKNPIIRGDAFRLDYGDELKGLIDGEGFIDYLSLDIDPAENTYEMLCQLPLDRIKFRTVTFEHDAYRAPTYIRESARKLMARYGYVLVGEDIKHNTSDPYEDWYVHGSAMNGTVEQLKNNLKDAGGYAAKGFKELE